jgi:hypothetical protein
MIVIFNVMYLFKLSEFYIEVNFSGLFLGHGLFREYTWI